MPPLLKTIIASLAAPLLLLLGLGIMFFMLQTLNVEVRPILTIIIALSPIWLPFALFYIVWEQWMWSVQTMFGYQNGRTTLRIKLPQEVFKSPEAMESVLTIMHNVNNPDNLMQTYLEGKHALVSSLELVSIGGDVRFYANVPTKKIKNLIESQLYAQYPGIEITEEKIDYTAEIVWNPEKYDMLSFHFGKKKEEVMPIKTYIDFGMDKLPKEELKFEPMSPMLECLGSVKPHERIWIQFLMTPHGEGVFKNGHLTYKPTWEVAAAKKVNELMGRDEKRQSNNEEETDSRPMLTMSERDTIGAIERNTSKYAYKVAIRAIYITENGKFDPDMIGPLVRSFAQYDVMGRNGVGIRWRTDFNYNFLQDITGARKLLMKKAELEYYKARYYLTGDKKSHADSEKLFSVEELATMWHIPGTSIATPNLSRVENSRKEAPANLPIQTQQ
jgi:hypothetical protein